MCAWAFADSFDCYAAPADAYQGYWDSGSATFVFYTGRFAGSRAIGSSTNGVWLAKSSGQNDAVHHIVVSHNTASLSGSTIADYIQLLDGTTGQCCIVFRSDGAITLTSGTPAGTVLATYTGAVPVINTWYAFEFEIIINNTTGRMRVRKNGNPSDDFDSGATLNTRGGTANNYANKLQIGQNTFPPGNQLFDDLFWRSDASSVAWMGDIRCYTRMPASDASTQFARTPAVYTQTPLAIFTFTNVLAGTARYTPFVAAFDGAIGSASVSLNAGYTGNMKAAIFATSGSAPTTILGTATPIVNPAAGANTFTFGTPVTVIKGTSYWIGFDSDTTSGTYNVGSGVTGGTSSTAYASFPVASPAYSSGVSATVCSLLITTGSNATVVNEPQQDATTSYVYDSTPGDQDFYGIASIASTPVSTVAVTTRALMQKSDAGSRTAAVQLRSGPPTVVSPTAWNPADKSASVALSNGNLTATFNSSNAGVRAVDGVLTGKYYWECTIGSIFGGYGIGMALASAVLAAGGPTTGNAVVASSGVIAVNNVASGSTLGGLNTADIIGIAIDMTAQLIWFRKAPAGNWNGSGTANPTTGVGGVSISGLSGTLYPTTTAASNVLVFTANFGGSAFSGAVPSGFTSGIGPLVGTTVASPTLTLTTSGWLWAWRTDVTDPATGTAWTAAGVNNAQAGPKVIA